MSYETNIDLRLMISGHAIKYKDIAYEMGVTPEHLSRLMSEPLKPEMKTKVIEAVDRLKMQTLVKPKGFEKVYKQIKKDDLLHDVLKKHSKIIVEDKVKKAIYEIADSITNNYELVDMNGKKIGKRMSCVAKEAEESYKRILSELIDVIERSRK